MCLMYYKFQGPLYLETVFVSDAKVLEWSRWWNCGNTLNWRAQGSRRTWEEKEVDVKNICIFTSSHRTYDSWEELVIAMLSLSLVIVYKVSTFKELNPWVRDLSH